jgi:putative phosphoesterase
VAHIVHGGDVGAPGILDELAEVAPVTAVFGNIDGATLRDLPARAVMQVAGIRVGVLHIAGNPWRPNRDARNFIADTGVDVLVCGHSHAFVAVRADDCLWLNPGAAGRQGFHAERTAALLGISQAGELRVLRIGLGPRSARSTSD